MDKKAAIGLSGGKLIIKLSRGKRMAGGSKLVCVCVCEDYAPEDLERRASQLFCSACQPWPGVRRLASAGEPLCPGLTGKKVPTELMGVSVPQRMARSESLGHPLLQKGCSPGDPRGWGSFSQFLRLGRWHSSADWPYLHLGHQGSRAIVSILIEAKEDE